MSTFITKFGYVAGEYILSEARAHNGKGFGPYSLPNSNTIVVQTAPTISPSSIVTQSLSSTSLNISWAEITGDVNTGYSAIQGYYIYHNGGSGTTFSNKITASTYLGTTLSGLTVSTTYLIKISAYNIQGEGPASSIISVIAAFTPGQPLPPIFSLNKTNVILTWSNPTDTGGDAITGYKIVFLNKATAAYEEHVSLCDGSQTTVIQLKSCTIPMTSFISTLGYTAGQTLLAEVQARNSKGLGVMSNPSTSLVVAQTPPIIAPLNFIGNSSSSTSITLSWNLITSNVNSGYSTVKNYTIYQVISGSDSILYQLSGSSVNITGLTTGNYTYKISATND